VHRVAVCSRRVRYRTGACAPALSRGGNIYADLGLAWACEIRRRVQGLCQRFFDESTWARSGRRATGFQIEMTYRRFGVGAKVTEVPIRFVDRSWGTSKMVDVHRGGGLGARYLVGHEASRRPASRRRQEWRVRRPVAFGAVSKGGTRAAAGGSMAPIDAGAGPSSCWCTASRAQERLGGACGPVVGRPPRARAGPSRLGIRWPCPMGIRCQRRRAGGAVGGAGRKAL